MPAGRRLRHDSTALGGVGHGQEPGELGGRVGGEVIATTVLEHAAALEHQHLVHAVEGGETVGDDHHGAAAERAVGGLGEAGLGVGVEPAGGLVEQHEPGIGEQDAGEGEQLGLAGGEARPAVEHGVEAIVEAGRPLGEPDIGEGGAQLVVGGVDGAEEGEVVAERRAEELHVLAHHRDPAAEVVGGGVPHVDPAEPHAAVGHVPEACQQTAEGGLAAAGAADHAEAGAGGQVQVEVDEHVGVAGVGEGHVVEVDRQRPGREVVAATLGQGRHGGEQARRSTGTGRGLLELAHLLGDALDGLAHHLREAEHGEEGAEGDARRCAGGPRRRRG